MHENGLWKKESKSVRGTYLKLSVYVDDNLIAGANKDEVETEMDEILKIFAGREIKPKVEGDWIWFDILG